MKLKLLICGWLFFSASLPLMAGQGLIKRAYSVTAEPRVRILLERDTPSALLEAKGAFRVVRKDNGSVLSSGGSGKRFVVHALQDGMRWGEEYPDVYQIALIPTTKESSFLVNGIQYKGAIAIYRIRDNHIAIVNEVPIEEYLKSTLSLNYDQPLAKEALAALVIAARTEAYNKVTKNATSSRPWDLIANEINYCGCGITQQNYALEESVDRTRFMVLTSTGNKNIAQESRLTSERVNQLAEKGYDAQRILTTFFPHTKIDVVR